ncbi:hypothetical protein QFC24_005566 [Naganishia onofrii]|uniref:Uncharacterized protein n=1 Tax=Naganishia onofrii TaxID=1851511 RepID=A0ACC2XAP6_9TREE|nr:hypothetical protein QFC24_005566 [Naganishia onofrii]
MPQGAGIMYIEPRSPVRMGFSKTAVNSSPPKTPTSTPAKPTPSPRRGKSLVRTLLWLSPLVTLLPYLLSKLHYSLPEPRQETHLSDGTPVVSEANIMKHIQVLEDIGYRIVGTVEAVEGELYVLDQAEALANKCAMSDVLECNLWYQKGDGMHQFDIMDHAVLKSYRGIGNIILQIGGVNTTRTIEGDPINNAILLNAHIDSALPSPGAADDGVGVGVMLDCARVLIERDEHITGSAIFLFNGAEETLQDASHLYSMQHETKDIVKAVINLEAAGSTGGALLFQATSKEMIEAYSKVPRPHGTVVAADVFSSGIIMSDTDFVQFEKYLGISGLDYWLFQRETADQAVQEHAAALAAIGFEVIFMALMQAFQLRSAYLFSNMAIVGLIPLLLNEAYSASRNKTASVSFGLFHWLWTALCMVMLVEASTNFLDIFVPLTGRMGKTTSGTHTLHVAQLDSGPGFPEFVTKVHERYGMQTRMPVQSVPSDSNSDWDILYPISAFIEAEKFPVIGHTWPAAEILPEVKVRVMEDSWDENLNTRNITLGVNHEGLIYPVLAFSADVVEWSFQTAAPVGHTRHYVKAASSPGKEDFLFHMSFKTQDRHDKLGFHWVGIDTRQMYPATSEKHGAALPTTVMFREMDGWLKEEFENSMEVLLVGAIAGVFSL